MKKIFSTHYSAGAFNFATLLLRLAFGGTMMINHGLGKLKAVEGTIASFNEHGGAPLGLPTPVAVYLLIFAEFFCSIFIILGLFTRLACIPLIIAMGVAFFVTHNHVIDDMGYGSFSYLIVFVVLLLTGPGKASIDALINKR